jgi:SHS family lactate transporter-like MFS transporter
MWPGVAYQIGNMVSSASAQIEAVAGERIRSPSGVPEYGKVSAILIGVSAACPSAEDRGDRVVEW